MMQDQATNWCKSVQIEFLNDKYERLEISGSYPLPTKEISAPDWKIEFLSQSNETNKNSKQ